MDSSLEESMNNINSKFIEIYFEIGDFKIVFISELQTHQLSGGSSKRIKTNMTNQKWRYRVEKYLFWSFMN